jgi:hypothetical protein
MCIDCQCSAEKKKLDWVMQYDLGEHRASLLCFLEINSQNRANESKEGKGLMVACAYFQQGSPVDF